MKNPMAVACLPGRLQTNTEKLRVERQWGFLSFPYEKKKKMERGNKNKLHHIPICTKQIMLSKSFEYKIIHYCTTLSIQSAE